MEQKNKLKIYFCWWDRKFCDFCLRFLSDVFNKKVSSYLLQFIVLNHNCGGRRTRKDQHVVLPNTVEVDLLDWRGIYIYTLFNIIRLLPASKGHLFKFYRRTEDN